MPVHPGMHLAATVARSRFADPRNTRTLVVEAYIAVAADADSRVRRRLEDVAGAAGTREEARPARQCRGEAEDHGCDVDGRYSICQTVRLRCFTSRPDDGSHIRKDEENNESTANDYSKSDPTTPFPPGAIPAVSVAIIIFTRAGPLGIVLNVAEPTRPKKGIYHSRRGRIMSAEGLTFPRL